MSATKAEKSSVNVQKLGIIAGGGHLPFMLLDACRANSIEPYILAFKHHTDPALVKDVVHNWTSLGALQKNVDWLEAQGVKDIVFCGDIKRPSLRELKPDMRAAKFFARHSLKALGDNDLLTAVKRELEKDGFILHGVHDFVENILTPEGVLGGVQPSQTDMADIAYGVTVSQEMGRLDIGQSVIVQDGVVIGVEAVEGTDALIARAKPLLKDGNGRGVLIKTCKPQQDKNIDLPTMGKKTIENIVSAGLAGIAVHAGQSLILDCETVVKHADKHGVFIYGSSL